MKKSHAENTVGPWAAEKLQALEDYLNFYTTALKNKTYWKKIYIDAFAGAGKSVIRQQNGEKLALSDLFGVDVSPEKREFLAGSPNRALSIKTPFDEYYFFDADPVRADQLQNLEQEYPSANINVRVGDANKEIETLIGSLNPKKFRAVAFLDPYGPHLKWSTLEHLAKTNSVEVIINFPLGMAINRLIKKSGENPENWKTSLDDCFGTNEWQNLSYEEQPDLFGSTRQTKKDNASEILLGLYCDRLKSIFGNVAKPRLIKNTLGNPLYYLIWAGPHSLGLKGADHILKSGEEVEAQRAYKKSINRP